MNMKYHSTQRALATAISAVAGLFLITSPAMATFKFLGVAAGDVSNNDATVWTRATDVTTPAVATLTLQVSTDQTFATGVSSTTGATVAANDYTLKIDFTGLNSGTVYFYRFYEPNTNTYSNVGRFKTAPAATASAPVHFAFSGDMDGLIRPYALATTIPAQNFDFYVNLGDVIYENASNLTTSGTHNGASYLNSPSVTLSNSALNLNGVPVAGTTFATQAQLRADYAKKYMENFLPVNTGGQNCLKDFYAAQGNYTTWDNHELGNRKYIDGGAPAGGSVGGAAGTDMATGRGVDARNGGSGNVSNVNDAADLLSPSALSGLGGFMNKSTGFQALRDVFLNYQPMADFGTVNNSSDPRSDGTKILYSAKQWGKNAVHIMLDTRSYRDIRLKTANAGADETTAPRANNASRTYLGATQLAWLKTTLLTAQNAGTTWKFVSVSDPMDQIGPIGGALTLVNLPSFGSGSTYGPVNADGGKAYMGGFRAERNALLKYIADNGITNVVFLSTDDHQNRVNELTYSPSGQTEVQTTYVKVPYCFSVVCGPLGATGPDLITNHTFAMAQQYANSLYNAQVTAGVEPIGLQGYPGLHNVSRLGDPGASANPTTVDFYSPDTFNYTIFDVSANGRTLSVKSYGMFATAQNAGTEYSAGPQASEIFSFQVDAFTNPQISGSGYTFNRALNKFVQTLTVKNSGTTALTGPIHVVLTGLSAGTTLSNATGTTTTTAPGSKFVTVSNGNLAAGASVTFQLLFTPPTGGTSITYTSQAVTGVATP